MCTDNMWKYWGEDSAAENVISSLPSVVLASLMMFLKLLTSSLVLSWWNIMLMMLYWGRASHFLFLKN